MRKHKNARIHKLCNPCPIYSLFTCDYKDTFGILEDSLTKFVLLQLRMFRNPMGYTFVDREGKSPNACTVLLFIGVAQRTTLYDITSTPLNPIHMIYRSI